MAAAASMAAVAVSTAVVVVDITGRAQRVHTMVAAGVVAITAVDTTVVAITVAAITVGVITVAGTAVISRLRLGWWLGLSRMGLRHRSQLWLGRIWWLGRILARVSVLVSVLWICAPMLCVLPLLSVLLVPIPVLLSGEQSAGRSRSLREYRTRGAASSRTIQRSRIPDGADAAEVQRGHRDERFLPTGRFVVLYCKLQPTKTHESAGQRAASRGSERDSCIAGYAACCPRTAARIGSLQRLLTPGDEIRALRCGDSVSGIVRWVSERMTKL